MSDEAGWDLGRVVVELRAAQRSGEEEVEWGGPERPSRAELAALIDGLRAALFPSQFGPSYLSAESVDYFVGYTLDGALRSLLGLIVRALGKSGEGRERRARAVVGAFASRLPAIRRVLETDVQAAFEGDPAAASADEVLSCYPGVTAILHHRIAHELYKQGVPVLPRMIAELAHADTGIDIHPGAQIGEGFFIDHGTGVVIGETATIGRRVRIYQGVTLGAKSFSFDENGVVVKGQPRHPIVEDDVTIYAGATILGRITIGKSTVVGGNVWVTRSVPPGSRVTQAQARSETFDEGAGI